MDLEIAVFSQRYDVVDERWLAQIGRLATDFRQAGYGVTRRASPEPNTKGVELGPIIVSLGSAGAFAGIASILSSFIGRDRGRSVRVSWHADGKIQSIEVTGADIDAAMTERVVSLLEQASEAG